MTPAAGYVYAIALSNGTVKVGRSKDAKKRLVTHGMNARALGLTVTDSWTSPLHLEWRPNEDALKKAAAELGGFPEGREVFSGIEFDALVEKARGFIFTAPSPAPAEAAAPHRTTRPPVQKKTAQVMRLDEPTVAFLGHMGRAINSWDEGLGRFRQEHPTWADAFELAGWLEDTMRQLNDEVGAA